MPAVLSTYRWPTFRVLGRVPRLFFLQPKMTYLQLRSRRKREYWAGCAPHDFFRDAAED